MSVQAKIVVSLLGQSLSQNPADSVRGLLLFAGMLEKGAGGEGGAGAEATPGGGVPAVLEEDGGRSPKFCCHAR